MVGKQIREVRCADVLRYFFGHNRGMAFMTLTTPDVVTLDQIRARWRNLRHYLAEREGEGFKYVMNYELHPKGHGWHIHGVFNRYINLRGEGLSQLRRYGFKMINVKRVGSVGVSLYLSKHCLKAYRGVRKELKGDSKRLRLVNTSRGLPRLSDYVWQSKFNDRVRELVNSPLTREIFRKRNFRQLYAACEVCALMDWSPARYQRYLKFCRKRRSIERGLDWVPMI